LAPRGIDPAAKGPDALAVAEEAVLGTGGDVGDRWQTRDDGGGDPVASGHGEAIVVQF